MAHPDVIMRPLIFISGLFGMLALGMQPWTAAVLAFALAVLAPAYGRDEPRRSRSAIYAARWVAIILLLVVIVALDT